MTGFDELRELAEKATPGPWAAFRQHAGWSVSDHIGVTAELPGPRSTDERDVFRDPHCREADAAYIAGADPTTVIDLLNDVLILRDLNEGLERQIDAEAKHAALGPGESCDVCTHMEVEEMVRQNEQLWDEFVAAKARAEAAEAEVARVRPLVYVDKVTGEPCPTLQNRLCTILDPDHRHVSSAFYREQVPDQPVTTKPTVEAIKAAIRQEAENCGYVFHDDFAGCLASAVLALLPGRTEAEVAQEAGAKALRDAADELEALVGAQDTHAPFKISVSTFLRALADRVGSTSITKAEPWQHPGHHPVQHRDGKPPWCDTCGWTSHKPAVAAVHIGTAREAR